MNEKTTDVQGRFRLHWDFEHESYVIAIKVIIEGKEWGAKIPLYEQAHKIVTYEPSGGGR
jgi:hypothetical protein